MNREKDNIEERLKKRKGLLIKVVDGRAQEEGREGLWLE